jgi:integrase
VLSDNELKVIWHYNHPPFSTILKLLILTGQRRSQIWKLQPHWIEDDLITFPRERPANVFW